MIGRKDKEGKEIKKVTETELILSFRKEKDFGVGGANGDKLIRKFRETYGDQGDLMTKAAQGDPKALRRLRWIFGLKVITKTNHSIERR